MIHQILKETLAIIRYLLSGLLGYIFPLSETKNPKSKLPSIVLVHGFATQNPSLFLLKRRLEKLGYKVFLPNFGLHLDSIEKNAEKLNRYIKTHKLQNFMYIGFSMGGIIGLYYKNNYPHTIQKFISIGSPYYGTKMAFLLSFIPAAHQLRRNSKLLNTLHKKNSGAQNITSIRAIFDEVVIPSTSAHLLGTKDIVIPEIGHANLLFSKKAFEAVKKTLEL